MGGLTCLRCGRQAQLAGAVWRKPRVTRADAQQRSRSAGCDPPVGGEASHEVGGKRAASHDLRITRAANGAVVTVCAVCGAYASAAAEALAGPCARVAAGWGRRALAAFSKGRLPKTAGGVRIACEPLTRIAEPPPRS